MRKCVLVCANCHMEIHDGLRDCPESYIDEERAREITELISINKKKQYFCPDCGVEVYNEGSRCVKCAGKKRRKVEHPDRDSLKELI
ncbi:MAG: hypothetical protein ACI4VL_05680 [Bacilli bacterium]